MSTPQDPIRAQLIEARRTQILDAATEVFAEKGFHSATTKDIAKTAGVSEGTIYNYFDSKEDLLVGIMSRLVELESLSADLMGTLKGDPREFFITIFRQRMGYIQQSKDMMQALLPGMLVNPKLRERFYKNFVLRVAVSLEQYIQARIELGHLRPVDVPLLARTMQSMFIGLLIMRILGDDPLKSRWDDIPELLATMIFDGLSTTEEE